MSRGNLNGAIADYVARSPRSAALFAQARAHLPGGSTRSASYFAPHPTYQERGAGARVWDVDGNARVDFDGNYGLLVHGHCFAPIVERLQAQAATAHCFAAPTAHEVAWAERIKARLPSIELLRFTTSGSEAATLAMRAARAFTGRDKIAKFAGGYHGCGEAVAFNTPGTALTDDGEGRIRAQANGPGLPRSAADELIALPFNDLDGARRILARHAGAIAAVVVEPVMGAAGFLRPRDGFLAGVQQLAADHGALLVLDEVMMFRLGFHGAQGLFQLAPDLTLLGKTIGGGLPVGAVGGRADVMSAFDDQRADRIPHSGTYNANPLTAVAGLACLDHLAPEDFARMRAGAARIVEGTTRLLRDHRIPVAIAHVESMFSFHGLAEEARTYADAQRQDRALLRALHLGLSNAGIQITPTAMVSMSTVMDDGHGDAFIEAMKVVVQRYLS